ncbi:MAG: ASCH domain-containing protein [Chthonomonadales bacterium]
MSAHYPLPVADKQFADRLIEIYKTNYDVDLSFDEAKQLLEQMMEFIYLTQIDPIVFDLVGHYNDPELAAEVMKELTRTRQWHKVFENATNSSHIRDRATTNKRLQFHPRLADLIREGKKTSTWRLVDDTNLAVGDSIELCEHGIEMPFAVGTVVRVEEKPFHSLEEADWQGHERFASEEDMYAAYRKYYGANVGPDTTVKMVWFELVSE